MSGLVLALVLAAAVDPPASRPPPAQESTKAPDAPAAPKPAASSATPPKPAAPSMDFDLLEEPSAAAKAKAPDTAVLEAQIRRRRIMLQLHQALGLATLAGLAATEVVGQLNFNDKYRAGGDTGRYQALHLGLATGTSVLFAAVGLLGVFAPEPFEKHMRLDTATVHKALVAGATAGMLTQVVLGVFTHSRDGHLDQPGLATAHQIVGYTTLGLLGAGAAVLFF